MKVEGHLLWRIGGEHALNIKTNGIAVEMAVEIHRVRAKCYYAENGSR